MSEKLGQMSTSDVAEMEAAIAVFAVIAKARQDPFTTKSAFARYAANEIALCASEGFISTRVGEGNFSNVWMVTHEGLDYLEGFEDVFSD